MPVAIPLQSSCMSSQETLRKSTPCDAATSLSTSVSCGGGSGTSPVDSAEEAGEDGKLI